MIFLNTNVLIDVLEPQDSAEALWSQRMLARVAAHEHLMTNVVVVAELASGLADASGVQPSLEDAEIRISDLDMAAALRAGVAYSLYRRRGGARQSILADFLIAGHATVLGATLMTRDKRLAAYFPELTLITPETDHG